MSPHPSVLAVWAPWIQTCAIAAVEEGGGRWRHLLISSANPRGATFHGVAMGLMTDEKDPGWGSQRRDTSLGAAVSGGSVTVPTDPLPPPPWPDFRVPARLYFLTGPD
ncbi:hypothetical protein SKAU_G00325430 [Synaphobranchus kaupii]|uniref:Uncharacterized protein n=1 Tax=Synaphobranchus kaupii TaxID=118154 RepID=A0A9Q1IJ90_SYNKA|nr:hypothetical protein SKAU_G00325430 [Synaphobranchus kaupii]